MSVSKELSNSKLPRIGLLLVALSSSCMPKVPEDSSPPPTAVLREVEPPFGVPVDVYKNSTSVLEVNGYRLEATFLQNTETQEWVLSLGGQTLCTYSEDSGEYWTSKTLNSTEFVFPFGTVICSTEVSKDSASIALNVRSFTSLDVKWDSAYPSPR